MPTRTSPTPTRASPTPRLHARRRPHTSAGCICAHTAALLVHGPLPTPPRRRRRPHAPGQRLRRCRLLRHPRPLPASTPITPLPRCARPLVRVHDAGALLASPPSPVSTTPLRPPPPAFFSTTQCLPASASTTPPLRLRSCRHSPSSCTPVLRTPDLGTARVSATPPPSGLSRPRSSLPHLALLALQHAPSRSSPPHWPLRAPRRVPSPPL